MDPSQTTRAAPGLAVGEVVAGRYRIGREIGVGGSSSVWSATDLTLGRSVALKILHPVVGGADHGVRDRFLREARLVAAVRHPNVLRVLDFGVSIDGTAFMATDLLEGWTLAERIEAQRLDPLESVSMLVGILGGVAAVHDVGIVHRDLKPENVFLVEVDDGAYPVLLDFGISRASGPETQLRSVHPTVDGVIRGTPAYMAPEQARGHSVDHRADLYSCGVILYELLAEALPVDGKSTADILIKTATSDRVPIRERLPTLSPHLEEVVERALQLKPSARYASAREMRGALLDAMQRVAADEALERRDSGLTELGWTSRMRDRSDEAALPSRPPAGLAAAVQVVASRGSASVAESLTDTHDPPVTAGSSEPLPVPRLARPRRLGIAAGASAGVTAIVLTLVGMRGPGEPSPGATREGVTEPSSEPRELVRGFARSGDSEWDLADPSTRGSGSSPGGSSRSGAPLAVGIDPPEPPRPRPAVPRGRPAAPSGEGGTQADEAVVDRAPAEGAPAEGAPAEGVAVLDEAQGAPEPPAVVTPPRPRPVRPPTRNVPLRRDPGF